MRLLIADDEIAIRRGLMSLSWQDIGIEQVYEAENGIKAQEILRDTGVDIVISDIKMPGLTGLQLAEYVKERDLDTAVILLTGFSDFCYAQKAIQNGVVDYMLKPLRPGDILGTVSGTLKRLKQQRYQEKVVRQHERETDSVDLSSQISQLFHRANEQTTAVLIDMAKHFTQDISLNSMASKYHFSVAYLSKMIGRETGFSFSKLLLGMRLMEAALFLQDDNIKIGLVGEKAGFRDYRYFSQVFRKVFGVSPGEFRKGKHFHKNYRIKQILEMIQEKK